MRMCIDEKTPNLRLPIPDLQPNIHYTVARRLEGFDDLHQQSVTFHHYNFITKELHKCLG